MPLVHYPEQHSSEQHSPEQHSPAPKITASTPLQLSHFTLTTAAGCGNEDNLAALKNGTTGLHLNNFLDVELETRIGRVEGIEEQKLPSSLANYQCRNNQLAYLALQQDNFNSAIEQAKKRYASERIGVFLGTSTSAILNTELAYLSSTFHTSGTGGGTGTVTLADTIHYREQHNTFSIAEFVRKLYQLSGPAQVVSTACSSSAKVFASAARYIELGLCDAAIVGGVDSLCLTTLYGFNSLELLAREVCRPADKNRLGLSIGEAAAFALLEKSDHAGTQQSPVYLRGWGESSDAWHMSSPHPEGRGAFQAMQYALQRADIDAGAIDYVNLHGTATPVNDQMEDRAMAQLFSTPVACSSTKGWTGHTLGAAGSVEALITALCIQHNFMPQSLNTLCVDPTFSQNILTSTQHSPVHTAASNSFGFGGNNCCLIFSDQPC